MWMCGEITSLSQIGSCLIIDYVLKCENNGKSLGVVLVVVVLSNNNVSYFLSTDKRNTNCLMIVML